MGFNPVVGTKGTRGRSRPMPRASGGGTVRTVRTGSFTKNAVADVAEVPTGDVRTRALNRCFGGLHVWTLKGLRKAVNPSETTQCVRTCQDVSERVGAIGRRRKRLAETPPPKFFIARLGALRQRRGLAKSDR